MAEVIIEEKERINLVGLILKEILVKNLEDKNKNRIADKLTGSILITVEKMKAGVQFKSGEIIIKPELKEEPNAKFYGKLRTLLDIATNKNYILPFFKGELKFSGNIFLLLKFAKLVLP